MDNDVNNAVDAMLKIVQPGGTSEDVGINISVSERPVVAVTQEERPICEWSENTNIFHGSFPDKFLLGKGIPKGTISQAQWKHFSLYYDGRFEDAELIASGFNQLQRSSCIRRSAKISVKQKKNLNNLGNLANSLIFRKQLLWAHDNPHSQKAKVLNAKVCRVLSMIGSSVPYSPFERSATRPKLAATGYRYGAPAYFVTGTAEFEDLAVLRPCIISKWNDPECPISKRGFQRSNLPVEFSDVGARQRISLTHPMATALAFHHKLDLFLNYIVCCPSTLSTKCSRDFSMREKGAYGEIVAINGVIETQANGRLHWHMSLYASVLTPHLLTRLVCAPPYIRDWVSQMLDSIICTRVPKDSHDWLKGVRVCCDDFSKRVRASDLIVPAAKDKFQEFLDIARKKALLTGMHSHTKTCEKGKKGQSMCRMGMARGVHARRTCPLIVSIHAHGIPEEGKRPKISGLDIDQATVDMLLAPKQPILGLIERPHPHGPIIWELERHECDKYFVECNLIAVNLLDCHNNSQPITGEASGAAVEEYQMNYMVKEGAPLKHAASIMLAALDHIQSFPSEAEDAGQVERTGKHLAQRTVNAISGSNQWALPLMASALLGNRSHITSETFRYVFAHDNVSYLEQCERSKEMLIGNSTDNEEERNDEESDNYVDKILDDLIDAVEGKENGAESCGGTATYKIKGSGKIVFLSQCDSYVHRGPHFEFFSQLEFECIVELIEKKGKEKGEFQFFKIYCIM